MWGDDDDDDNNNISQREIWWKKPVDMGLWNSKRSLRPVLVNMNKEKKICQIINVIIPETENIIVRISKPHKRTKEMLEYVGVSTNKCLEE